MLLAQHVGFLKQYSSPSHVIDSSTNANRFCCNPMKRTLRSSISFPLPQCRGHLDNDHHPRRAVTASCAIALWPEASCALCIVLCSELQQDQAYQPTAVSADLAATGKQCGWRTGPFPAAGLYKEQRKCSDGGNYRKSSRCFEEKRRISWDFRVKQRGRGRVVTKESIDSTHADTKLHPMSLWKSALSFPLPGHLLVYDVFFSEGRPGEMTQ